MGEISQRTTVLRLLHEAGARGVRTNEFLQQRIPRFSARLYELRKMGWCINSKPDPQSASGQIYTLAGFNPMETRGEEHV